MNLAEGRISAIVCAYNEVDRIGRVLETIVGHPLFGEVIVVDDKFCVRICEVVGPR